MMYKSKLFFTMLFFIQIVCCVASPDAKEWYESQKYVSNDPYSFFANYINSSYYSFWDDGTQGLYYGLQIANLREHTGYFKMTASDFKALWDSPKHTKILKRVKLTTSRLVKIYSDYFREKSKGLEVPFFMNVVPLPGGIVGSVIVGVLSELAESSLEDMTRKAGDLASTIANGGEFIQGATVKKLDGNNSILYQNIVYTITVGYESRTYFINSMQAPIKIE